MIEPLRLRFHLAWEEDTAANVSIFDQAREPPGRRFRPVWIVLILGLEDRINLSKSPSSAEDPGRPLLAEEIFFFEGEFDADELSPSVLHALDALDGKRRDLHALQEALLAIHRRATCNP